MAVAPLDSILVAEGTAGHASNAVQSTTRIRTLEDDGAPRRCWTSGHIDLVCATLLSEVGGEDCDVLPYAGCERLGKRSGERARLVMAVPAALKTYLDDKYATKMLFSALRLPEMKWFAATPTASAFARARDGLDYPYVARAPFGSTGARTFLVESEEGAHGVASEVLCEEAPLKWLFEEYVDGYSLNINAVASQRGLGLYPPSVQILGERCGASAPFVFCGSDYAAAACLPAPVLAEVRRQTQIIAGQLVATGFRGVFGIDFLVDREGVVYPCEINPRFQNSTALLNYAFSDSPDQSPARRHISSFGPPEPAESTRPCSWHSPDSLFSQLSVHSKGLAREGQIGHGIAEGLYAYDDGRIEFIAEGHDPRIIAPGTFLAVDTVAQAGTRIEAGASLARLIFRGAILSGSTLRLADRAVAIANWIRDYTERRAMPEVEGS